MDFNLEELLVPEEHLLARTDAVDPEGDVVVAAGRRIIVVKYYSDGRSITSIPLDLLTNVDLYQYAADDDRCELTFECMTVDADESRAYSATVPYDRSTVLVYRFAMQHVLDNAPAIALRRISGERQ